MNVITAKNPVDLIGGQPEFPLTVTNGNSKIHYNNENIDAKRISDICLYKFIIIYIIAAIHQYLAMGSVVPIEYQVILGATSSDV